MQGRRRGPAEGSAGLEDGPAVLVQRTHDWGWDAVLGDSTVVQSWPSAWKKIPDTGWGKENGMGHGNGALVDEARLGHIAQTWCRSYNAGGTRRARAGREAETDTKARP